MGGEERHSENMADLSLLVRKDELAARDVVTLPACRHTLEWWSSAANRRAGPANAAVARLDKKEAHLPLSKSFVPLDAHEPSDDELESETDAKEAQLQSTEVAEAPRPKIRRTTSSSVLSTETDVVLSRKRTLCMSTARSPSRASTSSDVVPSGMPKIRKTSAIGLQQQLPPPNVGGKKAVRYREYSGARLVMRAPTWA